MHHTIAALLPLLPLAVLTAQDGVRIVQVPEQVRLPAPGSNLLLEVEAGAAPEAIWLAVDRAAQDRVPLVAVGNGRYQINLAAPAVADLLPSGRDQGDLFVFARHGDRQVASPAIAWTRLQPRNSPLRCIVRGKGGIARRGAPSVATWIDPTSFAQLEIEGAAERQSTAVARLGELDLPLTRRPATGTWALDPTTSLRERLAASGTFEVEVQLGAHTESFPFRCVPAQLDLPAGKESFVVQQRKRATVPGSRGWLELRLDDITMGRVMFELVTAEGDVVVPAHPVHERDHVEFALGERRYVIAVQRLVNLLIGDDHGEFVVQPAAGFRPDRIAQLLHAVEHSADTFVREGKDYTGAAAAQFLVAKLGSRRGDGPTVDEFVDRIGSQSSRSGEPYQVRRGDGTTLTMREWLRAELQRLDAASTEDR